MELLLSLCAGLGLAAACGFRIFVPFLMLSLIARADLFPLPETLAWVESDLALGALLVATVLEIGAFYIPWVDNLLDSVATPVAMAAGMLAMWMTLGTADWDPFWQWLIVILGGGGAAGLTQLTSVGLRGGSLLATGGLGNPVVATTENTGSVVASFTALLAPLLIIPLLLFFVVIAFFLWLRKNAPSPRRRD